MLPVGAAARIDGSGWANTSLVQGWHRASSGLSWEEPTLPKAFDTSEAVTLRQQVGSLPAHIVATWRSRYVPVDGIDLEARAILNQEAAAIRAQGTQPDALTIWIRLTDQVARIGSPSPELLAAAALAGLAAGVRTQGFNKPDPVEPDAMQAD